MLTDEVVQDVGHAKPIYRRVALSNAAVGTPRYLSVGCLLEDGSRRELKKTYHYARLEYVCKYFRESTCFNTSIL